MASTMQKTERIHGLDALRAIMMLLGLVIHSAVTYSPKVYEVWKIKDPVSTHIFFDMLGDFIHVFRMPLFFVIAGFFGALLFYDRNPRQMIMNRVRRIVYPFVVGWFILWPLVIVTFTYTILTFAGNPNSLNLALAKFTDGSLLAGRTIHLWFLYYLIMFSVVVWGLALRLQRYSNLTQKILTGFEFLNRSALLRPFIFGAMTFVTFYLMNSINAITSTSFIPNWATFLFYIVFYLYGWVLFKAKHFLQDFMRYDWALFGLGLLCFAGKRLFIGEVDDPTVFYVLMATNAVAVWLFIFSFTGLFLRYLTGPSAKMRYMSDASYWIYLVHLPLTGFFPALLGDIHWSPFLKFLIVLSFSTVISTVTYHYFVRATAIGQALNGRKYPIKKPVLVEQSA